MLLEEFIVEQGEIEVGNRLELLRIEEFHRVFKQIPYSIVFDLRGGEK